MIRQKNNIYINQVFADIEPDFYDALLYQVNKILYDYGDHQKANHKPFSAKIRSCIKKIFVRLYDLKYLFRASVDKHRSIFLSNAYATVEVEDAIQLLPPWRTSISQKVLSSWKLANIVRKIYFILEQNSIKKLKSAYFMALVESYEIEFTRLLNANHVRCLIVPNDLSFFENFSIKIAKKCGIPTFVYLHGLPGRYNSIDDNRADYLIVWGKGLKDAYIKAGHSSSKILTLRHPNYSNFSSSRLRSSLEHVVVLSKSTPGTPSSSTEVILSDRSKSLYYVEAVKNILMSLGVKSAKLRLHPSESESFYLRNLTDDFYSIDYNDKIATLATATLVIGPTSTMILDAVKNNVNYILFDPKVEGLLLDNTEDLVEPFEGNSFIRLSNDIENIRENITYPEKNINIEQLNEYFNVSQEDNDRFIKIISL